MNKKTRAKYLKFFLRRDKLFTLCLICKCNSETKDITCDSCFEKNILSNGYDLLAINPNIGTYFIYVLEYEIK